MVKPCGTQKNIVKNSYFCEVLNSTMERTHLKIQNSQKARTRCRLGLLQCPIILLGFEKLCFRDRKKEKKKVTRK